MKYLLIFLLVSSSAFCDVYSDTMVRAIQNHWTFDFKVPAHPYATGFVRHAGVREHAIYAGIVPAANLPTHFDLTSTLTPVKDQGMCGGCWAFATVGVIENFPYTNLSSPLSLSEQDIIDCDTQSQGCNGGDFDGFDYAKNGLASEQDYPFAGQNQTCQTNHKKDAKVVTWAFVSGAENTEPTVDQIKTALYQTKAPVAVGIYAAFDLQMYNGGVFNSCSQGQIDHMVDVVGWDDTDNDWIVRNSWGQSWGENGYFRILRTDSSGAKCNSIGTESAYLANATLVN